MNEFKLEKLATTNPYVTCGYCEKKGVGFMIKFEIATDFFCSEFCSTKYCEQYFKKREGKLIL